jgi:hypothetical protein
MAGKARLRKFEYWLIVQEGAISMLPHVEPSNVAASVDKLLADRGNALLSMKALIEMVRQRTGTERSDADLEGLITKKAAFLGIAVLSDRGSSPQDADRNFG